MFYRSHKWIDIPGTVYETHRELRVRESRHTAMVFNKRYQNIDTGKFDTDKLPTLCSGYLPDLITRESDSTDGYRPSRQKVTRCNDNAWFVPKDNDWEEEEKIREEEERQKQYIANNKRKEQELKDFNKRLRDEFKEYGAEQARIAVENEKARLKSILNEHVYAAVLAEAESRTEKMNEERVYLGGPNHGQSICNVRPNKWIPK